ncbi:unnamed protein product [Candida verbasci]|uniref:Uncharacterized protein n=1 Tax=Candida verbasci TaxID=1227364 RepID=A0A9W4TWK8_9ASCO|nr:unnamed protein product [Candida verbasci]
MFKATKLFTRSLSQYKPNPQIWIHEVKPNLYKFSLSKNPKAIDIGSSSNEKPHPDNFKNNEEFFDILHKTFKDRIYDDFTFITEAGTFANAFMPIYDFRGVPKHARTPYIEDIFGYVQVDGNGKILKDTYQDNEMYQVCSGKTGLPIFSDFMIEELKKEIE